MKNPVAKQFSKLARHIRKRAARFGGEELENVEDTITAIANLRNLTAQIRAEVTPTIEAMIAAEAYKDNGYRSLLPNKPEMYGLSVESQTEKYGKTYGMGEKDSLEDLSAHNSPDFAMVQRVAALAEMDKGERQEMAAVE